MNKGRFIMGTVVGAAAGIVAGMLTAPKSGQETRADLKARAIELKEEAARRASGTKSDSDGIVDTLKEQAGNATNRVKQVVEDAKKDIAGKE